MTRQQTTEASIIVTTPEKWGVVARKQIDMSFTNLVRLLVIDKIHLLHDERGPAVEAIVARTVKMLRSCEWILRKASRPSGHE